MYDDLRSLYQEVILDHGKNPRNFYRPEHFSTEACGNNPLCGDLLILYLNVDGDVIEDVSFQGKGCAISTASASIMTDVLKGMKRHEAEKLFEAFHIMCTDDGEEDPFSTLQGFDEDALDRLRILSNIKNFPTRVKCATLAWHTLHAALNGEQNISTE